jgi:hypothetical protein
MFSQITASAGRRSLADNRIVAASRQEQAALRAKEAALKIFPVTNNNASAEEYDV